MFFREMHFQCGPIRLIWGTYVRLIGALVEVGPAKPQVTEPGGFAASATKVHFSEKHAATRDHLENRLAAMIWSAYLSGMRHNLGRRGAF